MNAVETRNQLMKERKERVTRHKNEAKELHAQGLSYSDIAKKMGVAESTAWHWCKN